jgi:hypothetical protein
MGSVTIYTKPEHNVIAEKIRDAFYPTLDVESALKAFLVQRITSFEKEKEHYV